MLIDSDAANDDGNVNGTVSKRVRRRQYREETKERRKEAKLARPSPVVKWESGLDCTTFLEVGGVSRVAPYFKEFQANCKHRWLGRRVVDVLADEFNAYNHDYWVAAAKDGRLRINGAQFDPEYCFNHMDTLVHTVHRHEPPVRYEVEIVHLGDDMLVVNKPASVPVHPCGRYQFNSIVHLLARRHGIDGALPVHRLDRLTSGILVLALNSKSARAITARIEGREMRKVYLARVRGEFPLASPNDTASVTIDTRVVPDCIKSLGADYSRSQWIVSNDPITCVSKKFSRYGVCHDKGKPSTTAFRRVSYNGTTSVVLCYPITGRTHQIRIHLRVGRPVCLCCA